MYKKIISTLIISLLIVSNNVIAITNAVNTNETNTPWTIEKAEHLAKKTLYGATNEKVLELYNAGSASAAVNILFPSLNGPDRTGYNNKMESLLNTDWLIETSKSEMREYYTFKKLNDPYEAKSKLFGLFEDTFSVDTIRDRINYGDIELNHDLLYSHTLGNYKEMIKRNLYNNGLGGDYPLGEYLDLFNQTRPKYPNENYSREILQLFLMLEYKPTESEDLGSTRNYTEEDVNAMAKIIFGFESDENTHIVTYNNAANTNTEIEFLDGPLKTGDSFPFYNSGSGILDIQKMKTSINGNNGLPDNIIDYIFSKRQEEIAIFLADKLYRFYVAENPSRSDLDNITSKIIQNNFEIYPTVKWLLSNNMMYSEKSMNTTLYKNPLELVIGTSKILGLTDDILDLKYTLNNIGWTPYNAGKIFGRDGYDDNSVFFTPYISNKWTTESSKFATLLIDNNLSFIENQSTAEGILSSLENKLYLGKTLDFETRTFLLNYINHDKDGNEVIIDFTDNNYVAKNIQGLIYIMLNLPEYILQSGYDIQSTEQNNSSSFYNNDSKLVFIKASGGLDWLHVVIPKNEYSEYLELRNTGALVGTGITSLNNDYYINSYMSPYIDLFNSGNLKIINRVGTPNHSRGHDSSSRKITSIDNTYKGGKGIFGDLISEEDPSKTIVLNGGTKPSIFRNGNYMGIGSSATFQINTGNTGISTDEKEYKITTLKNILKNRNYVGDFGEVFKNSAIIDDVARESSANGGREGSGYNMEQRFTFLESLYNGGLGNTTWMRADGGYDTHRNQKDYLNKNLEKVAKTTTDFFNRVKDEYNVTIVIYSEFGRTNKLNASLGVDHGMAGGMIVISNNNELIKNELPNKIYGNLSFKDSKSNWLGVGIDYRSVYTSIYKALYNYDLSTKLGALFNINDYIDNKVSETQLLRYEHKQYSGNTYYTHIKFNIDDKNYFSSQGSYIKLEYWTDTDPIRELSSYTIDRSRVGEKDYDISIRTNGNTKYYYKATIFDNQFNKRELEGSFTTPNSEINLNPVKSVFLSRFKNINVDTPINLSNSSTGVIMSGTGNVEYIGLNNSKIITNSGTYITEINGGTGTVWNGVFLNPTEININDFIGNLSIFEGKKINKYKIEKLLKIGAGTLGVGLKLNKSVTIEVNNIQSSNNFIIATSKDGINWERLENSNIQKLTNKIRFLTDHFSYFAIIQSDSLGNPIITNGNTTNSISYSSGSSGKSHRLLKDKCEYGDYSPSYYDRTCGIDPYTIHSNSPDTTSNDTYEELKKDLENIGNMGLEYKEKKGYKSEKEMKLAYIELKIKAEEKAKIYDELFTQDLIKEIKNKENLSGIDNELKNIISQKEVLILLREKLSFINIGGFDLIHIKKSNLNKKFEAIAKVIIRKKFDKEINNKLLNNLNQIIMYSAINELQLIEENIKEKNKGLLKLSINSLITLFKTKTVTKKVIKKTEEVKIESIKEKIIRINAKKRLLKESNK